MAEVSSGGDDQGHSPFTSTYVNASDLNSHDENVSRSCRPAWKIY
uniref:Uncharacterized protein n=1 Tax=Ascaris lumbricoides TaxID=6252 RepID=A0A0M3HYA0_ASCLU